MAALFAPEQVPRSSQFHILHRHLEAAAQFCVFTDDLQPLEGDLAEGAPLWVEKICIGLAVVSPHPSAKLVQLAQSVAVGAVDDDGVYVWQIEFGDNRSDKRHKHRGHVTVLK